MLSVPCLCPLSRPKCQALCVCLCVFVVRPRVIGTPGGQDSTSGLVEVSVTAGEDVTLPCEVQSVPPPIITWAKERQLISPFSPRQAPPLHPSISLPLCMEFPQNLQLIATCRKSTAAEQACVLFSSASAINSKAPWEPMLRG